MPTGASLLKLRTEDAIVTSSSAVSSLPRSATEDAVEQHPLISWFEQEVRPELTDIRNHLDQLLSRSTDRRTRRRRNSRTSEVGGVLKRPSLNLSGGEPDKPPSCLRRAMSNVSIVSVPNSVKSSEMQNTALGAVLRSPPDGSTLECLPQGRRNSAIERKDLLQILPNSEQTRRSSRTSNAITRDFSTRSAGHSSLATISQTKDMEKAAILHRFQKRHTRFSAMIWNMLEDPECNAVAKWLHRLMPAWIILTVCVTLLQTISPPPLHGVAAAVLEITIESIFLLEFLVRIVTCPNRRTFWFDIHNLIDLAAVAPLVVRASMGSALRETNLVSLNVGILLGAVPIIRILKLLRRFEKFHLLLKAFGLAAEALPVLLFMLFVIELVFSVLIFLVEPRENIPSLPTAIWFTMVTMTTVGYGDVVPTSVSGSVITGVLVVITVLYMAVPLGIIGNAFTVTWNERDRILLMQRTRERLRQWGYTAHDIPVLFRLSDSDDDGELDHSEFRDLLKHMNIGFSDERIFQLFNSFDRDHSGTVDDREFVRSLFPNSYTEIYESFEGKGC